MAAGVPVIVTDRVGLAKFVSQAKALQKKYGPQYKPNKLLEDMAAKGDNFYARFNPYAKSKAA